MKEMKFFASASKSSLFKQFRSLRGQISYADSCTRPDIAYDAAFLSHVTEDSITESDVAFLNAAVRKAKTTRHIKIPKLDLDSIHVVGYADGAFAGNIDLSSQLGFIILLKDMFNKAAIVHYGSWKCHRVTRSVIGAEIYALSHGIDYTLALANDLRIILGRKVKTLIFTDSKCIFDTITKLSTISEKRLLIDVASIRESYTNGDLTNIAHVASENNLADIFTKTKADPSMLLKLMETGYIDHPVSQWRYLLSVSSHCHP